MNKQIDVSLAEKIATEAHNGQIRTRGADKGKPYIIHPKRIAEKFKTPLMKSAAMLHDTIEDTDMTFDKLSELGVSEKVLDVVEFVTKKPNENYLDFIIRICHNDLAVKLKIADIEDNLESLEEGSLKDKYRLALWILKENKV